MDIEEHIKNVDWNRAHKKHKEMEQAKRQLRGLLASIVPMSLILGTDILNYLEMLGPQVQILPLKTMLWFILLVYCLGCVYSGYSYFKWSRYPVEKS